MKNHSFFSRFCLFPAVFFALFLSCQQVRKPESEKSVTTDDAALVIARYAGEKSGERSFRRVAVFLFTDAGGRELRYANLLTERVVARLRMMPGLEVVNRDLAARPARFLPVLTMTETPERIQALGREWGADAIVSGRVREARNYNEISALILDTRSGRGIGDLTVIESIENYRLGTDNGP